MMPPVTAVSVSPTRAVPVIVGTPVAGLLAAATVAVAALVRISGLPSSSVKLTFTLIVLPSSAATSV